MRVGTEPLDPFLALLQQYRPCPDCGSARVTVQRLGSGDATPLRATCADCGMSHIAPGAAVPRDPTSPGDS